jgi:hypothetical protein
MKFTGMMILVAAFLTAGYALAHAQSRETPVYDRNGHYAGSVFNNGNGTQTYTDRNGHFSGSAINQNNGTTSFYGPRGNFQGSAGSSIDRAFNFKK